MKRMRYLLAGNLLAGTTALIGVLAAGTPAPAETLRDALALAYAGNPSLQAARAQLRAVDETVPIAMSGWRPRVSVSGDISRRRNESVIQSTIGSGALFAGGTTLRTSQSAALSVSQPFFQGFRTQAGTARARANVRAQRARLQTSEQRVIQDAATAYFDVLRDTAVVELRINNVQVLTRQLEATQDRFRVGEITRTDVAQAEARLSASVSARILAEGNLQRSRAAYVNMIGRPPENLVTPDLLGTLPDSVDAALIAASENNPNLVAASYTAKAAQESIKSVRGELLPSLSLDGQLSKGWDTIADRSTTESVSARLALTVPLYQGGVVYARLRQAKHTAGQRRLEADQARLDARESATSAWESYQSAQASIASIETQIIASEIALEGVQREAEVGARTVLDVLDAEQELLDARVNLVTAQRDQLVASLQLLSSVGNLTAQQLGLDVALYDATDHFNDVSDTFIGSSRAAEEDASRR